MTSKLENTDYSPPTSKEQDALMLAPKDPSVYFFVAIWFGLGTGLLEALGQVVLIFFLGRVVWLSYEVVWMAPLANIFLFGIVGLILFLLARRWPKLINLRTATFIYSALSLYILLSLSDKLADYAKWLLAAGIAAQFSYLIARYPAIFYRLIGYSTGDIRFVPRSTLPKPSVQSEQSVSTAETNNLLNRRQVVLSAGVVVAGLALGTSVWKQLREAQSLAALPAPRPNMPNVLLIVMDTVRAKSLSLYGYGRATTPYLEEFAQRGVLFERAFSTAPWTLPSHASMFTGLFPHELFQELWQPLGNTYPTLAEVLSAQGYQTSGFIANVEFCTYVHGLNRGFSHYEDFPISPGQVALSSTVGRDISESESLRRTIRYYERLDRKSAQAINTSFQSWLTRRDTTRPFFTFLNYFDAHVPYLPPTEFVRQFNSKQPRGNYFVSETLSSQDIQELNDCYDGAIAYIDYQLKLLLTNLQNQGILDNTLVIITADHGEQFGEHNLIDHFNSVYRQTVHVPLLMWFPSKIPSNYLVNSPISMRNLPATIMQLLELDPISPFPGNSLARYWSADKRNDDMPEDTILSEVAHSPEAYPKDSPVTRGDLKSLIHSGLHYMVNKGDGREELYDIKNDPDETNDLATTEVGQSKLEQFRTLLAKAVTQPSTNG